MLRIWIGIVLSAGLFAAAALYVFIRVSKEIDAFSEKIEAFDKAIRALSEVYAEQEKRLYSAEKAAEELQKEIDNLPKEDLEARFAAEKAWDDGIREILSFSVGTTKRGGTVNG